MRRCVSTVTGPSGPTITSVWVGPRVTPRESRTVRTWATIRRSVSGETRAGIACPVSTFVALVLELLGHREDVVRPVGGDRLHAVLQPETNASASGGDGSRRGTRAPVAASTAGSWPEVDATAAR
ncbi:hypothetical protein SGLAM104S_09299 [Streptomyces glaucescens]